MDPDSSEMIKTLFRRKYERKGTKYCHYKASHSLKSFKLKPLTEKTFQWNLEIIGPELDK
jgi:hypothetical protein